MCAQGFKPIDDNEADALGVLQYVCCLHDKIFLPNGGEERTFQVKKVNI